MGHLPLGWGLPTVVGSVSDPEGHEGHTVGFVHQSHLWEEQ